MSLKDKLKIENIGTLTPLAFYAIVGILSFVILAMDFRLIHIGIIGTLSLITAYGLFKKRNWTIWLIIILFFLATTFSAVTLYYFFGTDLILGTSMIAYLVLTWIFTIYAVVKRKKLES